MTVTLFPMRSILKDLSTQLIVPSKHSLLGESYRYPANDKNNIANEILEDWLSPYNNLELGTNFALEALKPAES